MLAAVAVTMPVAAGGADGSQRWISGLPVVVSDDGHYEGARRDGQPHGHGVLTYRSFGYRYEGELRYGQPHGHGVMVSPEGWRYEGEWRWGQWHGRGVHTSPDGTRYAGEFVDGERHGYGVRTAPGGARDAGMFYKGRFLGRCSRDGHESGAGGPSPASNPR